MRGTGRQKHKKGNRGSRNIRLRKWAVLPSKAQNSTCPHVNICIVIFSEVMCLKGIERSVHKRAQRGPSSKIECALRDQLPQVGNCEINHQQLVEILCMRSLQELEIIRKTYAVVFGHDLLRTISANQRSNPLSRVAYLRLSEPKTRDAEILMGALFGGSVNLNTVIEIICTRSSSELHCIKEHYRSQYLSDLEKDLSMKMSCNFSEILVAVCKSSHCHSYKPSTSMALCDAKTLYEAVESGRTIDKRTITSLLSRRNTAQMKTILASYKQLYGHEFSKSIKNPDRCGQFGRELRVVIRSIQSPEKFFAKQLRMKNADAREMLIRVVVTRAGVDVKSINKALEAKRAGSLESLVRRGFIGGSKGGAANEVVAAILLELIRA